ncbi:PREDICTED: uncharacterized protein LOC109580300 [Amphimedon queenslandica]|uniref:ATP-dependent DNA helicase n=1 Tax=Amphimedon queenslandica TaxID=400682 RepID=A0AAN0IWH9_AMPQE|nr:PREDICTED: uncharacterized protein LOC109580300 [Amphimedon queenslandica]|eukprot:XP_019848907.1 PREDICTED: uncharacterized protein LOC109580300 [Amphimedon queenslandica]
MQGEKLERDISQEDIDDNATLITNPSDNNSRNGPAALSFRFESAAKKDVIAPDEYRSLMRGLNEKQRQIVFFHRKWCKEAILDLKKGNKVKPYHIFLSGPGGVGKSHVIRIIQSDTIKLLKLSGFIEPDEVIVLLTAPTGVAAFNIGGMTLHSSLKLGCNKYGSYKSLSHDKANTLRLRLAKLKLLIIDEISMVGSNMLLDVHRRLNEILVQPHDVIFGKEAISVSPYRNRFNDAVPIGKVQAKFFAFGKKGAEVTRYQFPLALARAIIGDFNEDLLANNPNRLLSFLTDNNFKQMVKTPTTDRGTLIDHVYVNSLLSDVVCTVIDCYYCDHDIVCCNIPFHCTNTDIEG